MSDSSLKDILLPQSNLTPDLARRDPNTFKKVLLMKVQQNPRMAPIFNGLESIDRISKEQIVLQETWTSEATGDSQRIKLGFHEIPQQIQDSIFYTASSGYPRGYEQQLVYRFTHEVTHKYFDLLAFEAQHPKVMELFSLAAQARLDGDVGFTSFGHIDNQGRQIKQANEDVTELLNMYIWNPQYLRDYLDLLANPHAEQLRNQHNLVSLDAESKTHIFQLVESIITSPNS